MTVYRKTRRRFERDSASSSATPAQRATAEGEDVPQRVDIGPPCGLPTADFRPSASAPPIVTTPRRGLQGGEAPEDSST